jgi:hypothetical protein
LGRPLLLSGVPTQISARSVAAIASAADVVADNVPAPTTWVNTSPSPGSMIGDVPAFTIATLSALTSTPITRWPRAARQPAVTHPT